MSERGKQALKQDVSSMGVLCLEAVKEEGLQVIVFCRTKRHTVSASKLIAKVFGAYGSKADEQVRRARWVLAEELKETQLGLNEALRDFAVPV